MVRRFFEGDHLQHIVRVVLSRHAEDGLGQEDLYTACKAEFTGRGNAWDPALDKRCGKGRVDKPQWQQNIAAATAAMRKKGMFEDGPTGHWKLRKQYVLK